MVAGGDLCAAVERLDFVAGKVSGNAGALAGGTHGEPSAR
jgi:hypothetical protein